MSATQKHKVQAFTEALSSHKRAKKWGLYFKKAKGVYMSSDLIESLNDAVKTIDLLKSVLHDAHYANNKKEVGEIEKAIENVNSQLTEKMSDSPPSEILEYISTYVELKLKIEELHIKKSTSILNSLKSWAPVLIPAFAAILTFSGLAINYSYKEKSDLNIIKIEELKFEQELVVNAFMEKSSKDTSVKLKALLDAGFFVHNKEKVQAMSKVLSQSSVK